MLSDEQLRELIELGEKATERPWLYHESEMLLLPSPSDVDGGVGRSGWCGEAAGANDGRFIAASANLAIPLALEVRRLREALSSASVDLESVSRQSSEQWIRDFALGAALIAKEAIDADQ